ncbi:MAG TPA: VWA domain-containing protein, partial [Motilibacteraceae bacterium]|nr:VWA domain-containing protein [Motilibacteraceae bacterium]
EARERGRLDGTLEQVRSLLDKAIGQERAELFPNPSDDARFREAQLDALPNDTARAVRELSNYDWTSEQARQTFDQLQDLLRREVLDSQFRGMKQALEGADPAAMQRVKDMLGDLNRMLEADARGEHTQQQFDEFMGKYGDMFPDNPSDLSELVDSLARRAAAAERLMRSLTPEQREELYNLMQQALGDLDLAREMEALNSQLRARRPDLDWGSRERMSGEQPLGMGDATSALEDLADLEELEASLGQDYPGASLDDVDEEAVRRALGRGAVDDLEALRQLERELEEQGYLQRSGGRLDLTPKAVRRLGQTALRKVFAQLESPGRGDHDVRDAGSAGERTGATRAWEFGDEQPIDVVRTVSNAVRRTASVGGGRVKLAVEDFEVVETERRTTAAVALLVDLSYSMVLRDTWGAAKETALALHALVTGQFPQDAVQIIGFSAYGRVLQPTDLASLEADMVQGTNLQHALMLAGRFLDKHPNAEPVVMVVTDGEPTAHLMPDGRAWFAWPPEPETVTATIAEVDRMTRRGATLNVFLLDDDPRLEAFVQEVARRNGGRVLAPSPERLGQYVVSDYLRARRGRRAR